MSAPALVSALILAGGDSTRMGAPKALLEADGEPVWRRIQRVCRAAGCTETVLLVPDSLLAAVAARDLENHRAVAVPEPLRALGPIGTILHGVRCTSEAVGRLLWAVDHPFVSIETARALIADPGTIAVPCHGGRRGHPVYVPSKLDARIEHIALGHGTLRDLIRAETVREVDVSDPAIAWNCNTLEELEDFARRQQSRRQS